MQKKLAKKLVLALLVSTILVSNATPIAMAAEDNVVRLGGGSRVETSVKVSKEVYNNANSVVVAGYRGEADALTGTLLASAKDAPLLLVSDKAEDIDTVKAEIDRLGAENVFLLGGVSAISEKIAGELSGYTVKRVKGHDRFDTAAAVAQEVADDQVKKHVFLTNDGRSGSLADALAAGPVSGKHQMPVLLTSQGSIPRATLDAFEDLGVEKITIVGGNVAVGTEVEAQLNQKYEVDRIKGSNRFETAESVAERYFSDSEKVVLANDGRPNEIYADALVGGYLGAAKDAPLLLTVPGTLNEATTRILDTKATSFAYVLGGTGVISSAVENKVAEIITPDQELDMSTFNMRKFNSVFLALVNDERARLGISSLSYHSELQKGTDVRSAEIADKLSHTRPNEESFSTAFTYLDHIPFALGENIAQQSKDERINEKVTAGETTFEKAYAELFYEQFRNSPGHYQNMINEDYKSLSVGMHLENDLVSNAMILSSDKPLITTEQVERIINIPYKTYVKNDPHLEKGKKVIDTKGKDGTILRVSEYTYKNEVLVSSKVISTEVQVQVIDEIVRVGTRVVEDTKPAPEKNSIAAEFLSLVNKERAKLGVNKLIYSPNAQKGADIRAKELDYKYDATHKRPDGSDYKTAFDYGGIPYHIGQETILKLQKSRVYDKMEVKNISYEKASAELLFEEYMNSPGHKGILTWSVYNAMSVGISENSQYINNCNILLR